MRAPYVSLLPDGKKVLVMGIIFPSLTVAMRDVDACLRDSARGLSNARLRLMAARIELARLGTAA